VIAWRLPSAGLGTPGRIRRTAPATERWWRRRTRELATADRDRAVAVFAEAVRQFGHTMTLHGIGLFSAVTPLFNALTALVAKAGVGDVAVLSGTGGAEMAMIESIWRASRGEIGVQRVIDEHGYHGPLEGEVSSRVWREDPAPLHAMIEHYRARGESDSPLRRDRLATERLPVMQRQVLAALPAARRPSARLLLVAAARTIPLRGVGKASFLQALDVIRAAARRIGEHLVAEGVLDDPEDVFYLLADELTGPALVDARALVAARRAWRAEHLRVELPQSWRGVPEPLPAEPAGSDDDRAGSSVSGIGAGPGVVEGLARVVTDPRFVDVEPGEVLIAPTTDPSWASIMFVSAALVVDIGSMISHAAVVARELGLPCVVNTRTGTRVFRDGDLVRVDGAAGTVELVKPVDRPGPGT
jgi:pyruvate,water dikinase